MVRRHFQRNSDMVFHLYVYCKTVQQNQNTPSFIYTMKTQVESHRKTSSIKLSRTSMSLTELKKRTQNHTNQNKNLQLSQINIIKRDTHSRGRLRLGAVNKPNYILPKDERNNPFFRGNTVINEQVLNKKGVLGLITVGAIKKNADYRELLNNKYQMPQKQVEPGATFMTNPVILINTYQQASKGKELQANNSERIKEQKSNNRSHYLEEQRAEQNDPRIKIRSSKKKVIKKEDNFVIPQQKIKLNFINGAFEYNTDFKQFIKQLHLRGMKTLFSLYEQKVKQLAQQYSLKKFTVIPDLNQTKKITDRDIVKSIQNAKLLGVYRKLKGSPLSIFANLLVMKVSKLRFNKIKQTISKLQRIKGKFKIKKFYREMLDRRWGYLTFKLGAFAESQRRAMELAAAKPEVEVHLISSDRREPELNTFYKWRERRMTHLLRLYNNEADHMILIVDYSFDLTQLLQQIEQMPSTWKKPQIHIIHSTLAGYSVEETADLYFGLRAQEVMKVKSICRQKKAFLIPHRISQYLPHITQIFSLTLFAGSFRESSKSVLFQDEADTSNIKESSIQKFTQIKNSSLQITKLYKQKLKKVQLSNRFFQSKEKIKALFISLGIRTPQSLHLAAMNQHDFFREFVKIILREKDQNTWVLKLSNSTFSRGLAFFETDSLKILKDNKKKAVVKVQEIEQIQKLIESILVQKIVTPHNSLLSGEQFVSCFKESGGYIESYLQNKQSVCIFGRIELNGLFTLLGSYKRYYAQKICFGAMYPGLDITQDLLQQIRKICSQLYKQNVFGYITLQLLVDNITNEIYFIDLVPHLQVFSELYFYYKRLLNINEIDSSVAALDKKIFYIPFIDNNGNKTNSWQQFQNQLIDHKITFNEQQIIGTKFLSLSTTPTNSPQTSPATQQVRANKTELTQQVRANKTELRYSEPSSAKKSARRADVLSMICIEREESALVRECLQSLNFLVSVGGQFNKFDKKSHSNHSDGLYLLDIIWRMRQLKREMS